MADARTRRLAERIAVIVAELLERRIKDPRLGFVTVTEARLTNDLREATVYYTVLGTPEEQAESAAALHSATGVIRSEVGRQLGLRHTPSIEFVADALPDSARRIDDLVAAARQADEELARAREGATWPATLTRTRSRPRMRTTGPTRTSDRPDDRAFRADHRRQAWRYDLARRGRQDQEARRHPPRRARGDARPDGDRRPRRGCREGHQAARLPHADREGVRGDDPARPVDEHRRRGGRADRRRARRVASPERRSTPGSRRLTGEISQVPPGVSAIKVGGQRAYKLTRAGAAPDLAARRVTVYEFAVGEVRPCGDYLDVDARIRCSSGTYIRALARDLGAALGTGGHLTALRRTAVGPYRLQQAHSLEDLSERMQLTPLPAAAAAAFPRLDLTADDARRLAHGIRIPVPPHGTASAETPPPAPGIAPAAPGIAPAAPGAAPGIAPATPQTPIAAFAPDGTLVALVVEESGRLRCLAVFADPPRAAALGPGGDG